MVTPLFVAPRVPSRQELVDAKVPLHYRDTCAAILIPLNECRRDTLFLPWKCQELRHAYEKCQYMECVAVTPVFYWTVKV